MEEKKHDEAKKVDEAWKETVKKEKVDEKPEAGGEEEIEVTFGLFLSGLMMEALVALGEVENPITKKKETNRIHAKFVIDTIAMLKDKTRNNLSKDEEGAVDSVLYELRMRFVSKAK